MEQSLAWPTYTGTFFFDGNFGLKTSYEGVAALELCLEDQIFF